MRRLVLAFTVLALLGLAAACEETPPATVTKAGDASAVTSDAPIPRIGDIVERGGSRYVVNGLNIEWPGGTNPYLPQVQPGKRLVAVDISQTATVEGDAANPLYFHLQDEKDFTYPVELLFDGPTPAFGASDIPLGQTVRGWVYFQIPADSSPVKVFADATPLGDSTLIADLRAAP